jgi:hypothetical protein
MREHQSSDSRSRSEGAKVEVAVHITHEAAAKIGGIGAVIEGICTTRQYRDSFETTLLYGPLFTTAGHAWRSLDNGSDTVFTNVPPRSDGALDEKLQNVIRNYSVDIVWGRRELKSSCAGTTPSPVDVVLVGTQRMNQEKVAEFKYRLWQEFGIQSDLYANNWDYEQYLRIAIPYMEILDSLYGKTAGFVHFAHEYMGIPSALAAVLARDKSRNRTAFIAHEVPTARFLVESHPGHDLSFYNILRRSPPDLSLEDMFGSHKSNPRNELIKLAVNLDWIFPVSDLVREEYMFLVPSAPAQKITAIFNGVPVREITHARKEEGRERIVQYTDSLLNFEPDVILTHVSRLVVSKGIWRDISLLYFLDELLDSLKLKGAYILLSTFVAAGRSPEAVLRMEDEYGWPVLHKDGWPDLVGMEAEIYHHLELFNSRSSSIKGVFINQFGFNQVACGKRVPESADFLDLRTASDAELGFSVYEPFGIAQLETVPFGGVAVLSSTCGCAAFLQHAFSEAHIKPFHIVDFTEPAGGMSLEDLRAMTVDQRDRIERQLLSEHARSILDVIPVGEARREAYLENAGEYTPALGWDRAVAAYLSTIRAT